jgi:hypothetical protein
MSISVAVSGINEKSTAAKYRQRENNNGANINSAAA